MDIKYKLLHDSAVAPSKSNDSDAGFDLTAISLEYPLSDD